MEERVAVRKTCKLFIDGRFPRSESGRTFGYVSDDGSVSVQMSQASRKDLRMAVRAARRALPGWKGRSGYNRGQILYRIAEMIEDRAETFIGQLALGAPIGSARREVSEAIDLLIWYAGWCDKYQQVIGSMNPVAGPYFNISTPEPVGVVGVISPDQPALLGLVGALAPVMVSGNVAVLLASSSRPITAVTFAEAVATADVPPGAVNILTGSSAELAHWLAGHMDVNALDLSGVSSEFSTGLEEAASHNLKRIGRWDVPGRNPYRIAAFTEIKTVWHPKGR